jgi:hypothetical protein
MRRVKYGAETQIAARKESGLLTVVHDDGQVGSGVLQRVRLLDEGADAALDDAKAARLDVDLPTVRLLQQHRQHLPAALRLGVETVLQRAEGGKSGSG